MPKLETVFITGNLEQAMLASNVYVDGKQTSPEAVRSNLELAINALNEMGVSTVLIEQGPIYDEPVIEYELQRLRKKHMEPLNISREGRVESVKLTRELADIFDTYIKTDDFFCNETTCPSVDDAGMLVIHDRNHVTKEYSVKLAQFVFSNLTKND
jgi:hypothetical protein